MKGVRVSHSLCMCVASHGYGGLGGGGGWYACGTKTGCLVACREMLEHFKSARLYTDDTRSHCLPGAPQEGSSLLSMQPVGYIPWCSMDIAVVVYVATEFAKEGALSELLYADDLFLMSETINRPRNKFLKWMVSFESKGLKNNLGKTKVMFSGGITKDGLSN